MEREGVTLCLGKFQKLWYHSINMTIQDFIKTRKYLIWWVKDYDKLNAEAIVEATLNYGDWSDVQALIKILGIKKTAKIFREKSKPSQLKRQNYFPEVINYFGLYFDKYA